MEHFSQLASTVYYTGVGAVLLATTVRFLYRLIRDYDQDRKYLRQLQETEIPELKKTLVEIAKALDVNTKITLSLKPPL